MSNDPLTIVRDALVKLARTDRAKYRERNK